MPTTLALSLEQMFDWVDQARAREDRDAAIRALEEFLAESAPHEASTNQSVASTTSSSGTSSSDQLYHHESSTWISESFHKFIMNTMAKKDPIVGVAIHHRCAEALYSFESDGRAKRRRVTVTEKSPLTGRPVKTELQFHITDEAAQRASLPYYNRARRAWCMRHNNYI